MVSYIQKTNRNSFTLRFKKYKRLRSDIWGRIAFANKRNDITTLLKYYGDRDLYHRIRPLSRRRKNIVAEYFKNNRRWKPFEYSITDKPEPPKGRPFSFRSALKLLRKKFLLFYTLRFKSKSLRKRMRQRSFSTRYHKTNKGKAYIECRADVLLYRCNLSDSIQESRRLIRKHHVFLLGPKAINDTRFFSTMLIKKANYQIPVYFLLRLSPAYNIIRKQLLLNYIWSRIKLYAHPPSWILTNYTLMIFLLIQVPVANRVRYIFPGNLATFLGAALYF
jgi:hypothetical protein